MKTGLGHISKRKRGKKDLKPLKNNAYEKRAFIYFDIISWLESKIENRSNQLIIREKAMRKIEYHENGLKESSR